jgi:outer membrane lipoprotein carrier protein
MLDYKILLLLIFNFLISSSLVMANTINAASTLATYLDGMDSLEADFEQIDLSMDGEVTTGKVALIRPGYFRWEVIAGSSIQLIIINGNDLLIYDKDLEQLIQRKVDRQQLNSPAILLSSSMTNMEHAFKITQIGDSAKMITFILHPINGDDGYQWLKFLFKDKILNSIHCKNNLGQEIIIKFTKIKVNSKIDRRCFKFNPPPHTDILDERSNNK